MFLIAALLVLITAIYVICKILWPEVKKALEAEKALKPPVVQKMKFVEASMVDELTDNRIAKLENLLAEKNKNINLLQNELKIAHVQVRDFDKIKSLLEEEIFRLREQNRIFRSELGLPAITLKENVTV